MARTSLAGRSADLARFGGAEISFLTQVGVRTVDGAALGFPVDPNTWLTVGGREVLWLGPDEWLVVAESVDATDVVAALESSLEDVQRSVVDVSANRAAIELADANRLELLSSGCPIDMDPRSWTEGRCAQTLFGRAQVLLQERSETTRLFVRPSFSGYVVDLLLDAVDR